METYGNPITVRDNLVCQGLLRCDNKGNLRIYNYTNACVYARAWNHITMNSRGIILNTETGEVVARPFPKFFNMGECPETMEHNLPWNESFAVFEKLDGWLGTLYRYDGEYYIATRGSFNGMGVADWATERLRTHDLTGLPDEVTLVFELISPRTKIVVDYGVKEDLVLLAAYNRHTGEEYSWSQVELWGNQFEFTLPKVFKSDLDSCRELLASYNGKEAEGFVIRFESGLRVKIKGQDYIRRAALKSNLTPLTLWKTMEGRHGRVNTDLRKDLDNDYFDEFDKISKSLSDQYKKVAQEIDVEYDVFSGLREDRKAFAITLNKSNIKHKKCMFLKLDNRQDSVDDYIWKKIRPKSNEIQ